MSSVNLSEYTPLQLPFAKDLRIGIVVAEWNYHITHSLKQACIDVLEKESVNPKSIDIWNVPGAFELTYATRRLCEKQIYDAVIAIGCVIRGETPHFDYICSAVAHGIKDCNLNHKTPAVFCVLTDDTEEQSKARSGGSLGNKGVEAAVTSLKMIDFEKQLNRSTS